MSVPYDIYGALADYTQTSIAALTGVWIADMPEKVEMPLDRGYAVITDDGFNTEWQFEDEFVDAGTVTFHVFAASVDTCRALAQLIKILYGTSSLQTLGAIPTDSTFKFIEITRTRFQITVEPEPDINGNRVYHFEIDFAVKVEGNYTT